ncbi:glycosyltransferase family 4 protein [Candidatus Uabimicrobium amorphum]|uniref:Glucosyltransferase n=1 Tax=Uabimicrobium amorphum TaxID=2596890 RepID=A0A5S9F289_UABAM|nr:glycosyltransferase family 4 protein [Candidatus Uabimicrobium amorphum]BBM82209.1 glucosyltransferase [Candidatus Uabimicrobium amorphum]
MDIAFCLFKYFPFGGLQSDFLSIAKKCREKGHLIDVYTRSWQGEIPDGFSVHLMKTNAITNVGKDVAYAKKLQKKLSTQQKLIVGFNKVPGLHVYFASDSCYARKVQHKSSWKKSFLPRNYHKLDLEASLFHSPQAHVMFIAPQQLKDFQEFYDVKPQYTHLLPPGINPQLKEYKRDNSYREKLLAHLQLAKDTFVILMVGSGFHTKGVDRSIRAIHSLKDNKAHLIIAGKGKETYFANMAKKLGVEKQVTFLGARSDIHELYLGSDMLLHPSYTESAGKVLLEATILGLPVITTANCGYAFYINKAKNGIVVPAPFRQENLNDALQKMRTTSNLYQVWGENGWNYGRENDLYSQHDRAVDIIEDVGRSLNLKM